MDPLDLRLGALQSRHTRRQVKASCLLSNSIKQRCPSFGPDLWELRSPTPLQCRWVTISDERHPRFRRQPICFPAPRERPSFAAWNAQGRALRYRNNCLWYLRSSRIFVSLLVLDELARICHAWSLKPSHSWCSLRVRKSSRTPCETSGSLLRHHVGVPNVLSGCSQLSFDCAMPVYEARSTTYLSIHLRPKTVHVCNSHSSQLALGRCQR